MVDAGAEFERIAMTAGAKGTRELGKALRVATGRDQPRVASVKPEEASAEPSMVELLTEQARHAMRAAVAVGTARSLTEMATAQGDFMSGNLQRMTQLNARYLAFVRDGIGVGSYLTPRR
ncbi:hypothetical protein [Cereibacter azotoformans]|uniref:hypothetical protein n=1 Tax=Cereibacter azotoformans TaxID=43057 RepID=UPI00117A8069|nr:hypothetical protein [Cereibacter azotoformans]